LKLTGGSSGFIEVDLILFRVLCQALVNDSFAVANATVMC